ncbi:MAG: D-glycero-beta-D-manno-heptose-7-phosphate kinase [Janthinobacterium lividum]
MQTLDTFLDHIPQASVLCVGDIMLDYFVYGNVDRISPEAPVPVFHETQQTCVLGGAGNVVRNLSSLSVKTTFISVIGDDTQGKILQKLMDDLPQVTCQLIKDIQRDTTTKTRYIAQHQQLLRADKETLQAISSEIQTQVLISFKNALHAVDVVILSDYGKGLFSESLLQVLIREAKSQNKPVLIDPKSRNYGIYQGATVLTPNLKELKEASGKFLSTDQDIVDAAKELLNQYQIEHMVITRSAEGMTLVDDQGNADHIPTHALDVFDVSGAGDTVLAMLAASYAVNVPLYQGVQLANIAAGIVVGKVGTATTTLVEIQDRISSDSHYKTYQKVQLWHQAQEQVLRWKRKGLKVGFTNGCFDLLHPGHISLLNQSKSQCDRLILGLNSDDSIKRLKGELRPIQRQEARAIVLASLSCVDMVVIFDEDTPLELIKHLKPDVLIKGADYTIENVIGALEVTHWGGKVYLASLVPDQSTTRTIAQMTL